MTSDDKKTERQKGRKTKRQKDEKTEILKYERKDKNIIYNII